MTLPTPLPPSASSSTLAMEDEVQLHKLPPLHHRDSQASHPSSDMDDSSDIDRTEDPEKDLSRIPTHKPTSKKEAATRTVTAQDWTGPDDPENPHNWPIGKKIYHMSIPGILCFIVTFGSSVYTPGVPDVMKAFHVSREAALLPLTLYTLGLAFGPVLAAPLSETYGRRIVYLTTIPISLLFTVGAGASQGFASLLVCRFLAGTFGGPCLAVGAGTNVELFRPINRAAATSLFLLAPFAGPAFGPTVGGFASENKGWRWTQWPILFIGALAWFYSFFQHETYKKIILQKRAKRLGIPPPKQVGPVGIAKIKFLFTVTLVRPVYMLVAEPIVGFYSLYTGFNFAVLFCFFAAFPYVFEGVYKFDRGMTGLTFLGIGLGCGLAVIVFVYVDRLTYRKRLLQSRMDGKGDVIAPEYRLYPAMIGSIILPIGLFWFGWSARKDVHWIVPIIATVPFACGNLLIFCCAALYLVDTYGPLGGASALAANGLVRYSLGACFPLFTFQMYEKLGIDWATSLLGFCAVALMPVPWVLFKYGATIRSKSHFETIKA